MGSSINNLKNLLFDADNLFLNLTRNFNINNKGIIFLLFHSVFKNQKELESNHVDSQWGFTINEYKYIFEKFLHDGYEFISHKQLLDFNQLEENKKYIYLHFDDGYYNNHNILSLLEEYKISAHFYIITDNVIKNKKFWWDFLFNKSALLTTTNNLNNERIYLQNKNNDFITSYISKKYGADSLKPLSDIDRPFSPKELKTFSSNKYVFIGNHTFDHSNLTSLNYDQAKYTIEQAEKDLINIIGFSEKIFSFPGSNFDLTHKKILQSLDFNYAISGKLKSYNKNNIFKKQRYNLGRYCFIRNKKIDWQIKLCMTKFSPYLLLSNLSQ